MKGFLDMKEIYIPQQIHSFSTFSEFAKEFNLGKGDAILTNEFIYDPIIKASGVDCAPVFQEKYGGGEPTDVMVDQISAEISKLNAKRIIAVGGGTVIDIAKISALVDGDSVDSLFDRGQLSREKGLIIIPTTCGTGSEVTNISIVNRTRKGTKMGLVSPAMCADYAVLIPEFLMSLPYYVFATSSIDALIHAVESYLGPKRTQYTAIYSREAMLLILDGYFKIAAGGQNVRFDLSEQFLRASNYAGIAFGNSGCAAVHAMSYALGAKFHVPHGESNYQFFTNVLDAYKKKRPGGLMADLESLICGVAKDHGVLSEDGNGIKVLEDLLEKILPRKRMREYGALQEDIGVFAKSTTDNQGRLLANNYVDLSTDEIAKIYQDRL